MVIRKSSVIVLAALALAPVSYAQQSANDDTAATEERIAQPILEEVIVSARRREEFLQETPVAITAMSAEQMKARGISNILDIKDSVPSLSISVDGDKSPKFFIRGIGQRSGLTLFDPGVGIYLNEILIPRAVGQLLETVDIANVQVLRGPQGTLFGKNNTGGAILFQSREPSLTEAGGNLSLRVGNFGHRDAVLSGNIPLIEDKLGARVAISSTRLEGAFENAPDGDNYGDENKVGVSGRLLWQVSDTFTADLFGFHSRTDENNNGITCVFQNPDASLPNLVFPAQPAFVPVCRESEALARDKKVSVNSSQTVFEVENSMLALTLRWSVSDTMELKSITGYSLFDDVVVNNDVDATRAIIVDNGAEAIRRTIEGSGFKVDDDDREQFTQEFQLNGSAFGDRLFYTVGLFGSSETINDTPSGQLVGPGGIGGIPGSFITALGGLPGLGGVEDDMVVPFAEWLGTISDLKNESIAVFGEFTYDITQSLSLTLGGRLTREERERVLSFSEVDTDELGQRLGAVFIPEFGVFTPITREQFDAQFEDKRTLPLLPPDSIDRTETFTEFTPSGTLTLLAPPNWLDALRMDSFMTYVTVSKGFKAGGFDTKGQELITVEPEFVTNYELGFKIDAVDRRLRVNGAFYHLDYDDIQLQVNELGDSVTGTEILQFFTNASAATVDGAELEVSFSFGNWSVQTSASYTNAKYEEFNGQRVTPFIGEEAVDRSSEPFFQTPEKKYSLSAHYQWLTDVGMFVPRVSVSYRDEIFTGMDVDAINFDSTTLDSRTLVNLRLAYIPSEDLNLTAFVHNATDEFYYASGFSNSGALGANLAVMGQRRSFGLELDWSF